VGLFVGPNLLPFPNAVESTDWLAQIGNSAMC
jgi:hypothetical protein